MLTTELTEDELKNVIHYSFSNRPIDINLWYELLDKLDLTDEDITTDFHDKIKNLVYELLKYDIEYFNTYGYFLIVYILKNKYLNIIFVQIRYDNKIII